MALFILTLHVVVFVSHAHLRAGRNESSLLKTHFQDTHSKERKRESGKNEREATSLVIWNSEGVVLPDLGIRLVPNSTEIVAQHYSGERPTYIHDCRGDGSGQFFHHVMYHIAAARYLDVEYGGCVLDQADFHGGAECIDKFFCPEKLESIKLAALPFRVSLPPECRDGNEVCKAGTTDLISHLIEHKDELQARSLRFVYVKGVSADDCGIMSHGLLGPFYEASQPLFRKVFDPVLMPTPGWGDSTFVIAVHLRRGDVSVQDDHRKRALREAFPINPTSHHLKTNVNRPYTTNAEILALLDAFQPVCRRGSPIGKRCEIHIFTKVIDERCDVCETLDIFRERQYILHLSQHTKSTLREDWYRMSRADVLIMDHSDFSYVPAMLSERAVVSSVYQVPMPHWMVWRHGTDQIGSAESCMRAHRGCDNLFEGGKKNQTARMDAFCVNVTWQQAGSWLEDRMRNH